MNGNGVQGNFRGVNTSSGFFQYDGPFLTSFNQALVTTLTFPERCYTTQMERTWPSNRFSGNEANVAYGCNRGGDLSYKFNVGNGSYRLLIGFQEDKWQEFPININGRAFSLYIQREFVDVVNIYGELGFRRAALDLAYCVEVVDGTLQIDLQDYSPFVYGATPSFFELVEVAVNSCRETIHKRAFDVWYTGPGQGWTYAINALNSQFTSSTGVNFSPDFGYWFENVLDPKGREIIGWSGSTGYRLKPILFYFNLFFCEKTNSFFFSE